LLLKPDAVRFHKTLAECLLQQKKNEAALLEYRTALQADPTGVDAGDIKSKIDYLTSVVGH
jgi:hypothetical protein